MSERVRFVARFLPVVLLTYLWVAGIPFLPASSSARAAGAAATPAEVVPGDHGLAATRAATSQTEDFVVVRQRGKAFDPPIVVIHEGDSVVWVNESVDGWHDVQSYEGQFSSERMVYGDSFVRTFDQSGVYGYYCTPHVIDGMQGAVVVLPKETPLPDLVPPTPETSPYASTAPQTQPGLPDTIITVAGGGGSGGKAVDASLYLPEGIALDDKQNVYIADTENCQIRRVEPDGRTVSILGHESCGFSMGGDADLGTWQHTNHPRGVAVGPDGLAYVADTINCRIRRVEETGTVSTIAGSGSCRASGDGGPAMDAGLSPWGLSFDAQGNLYIADVFNCRIRKLSGEGVITTVAGNGVCGLSGDGGPATQATLFFPRDVAVGPDNALWLADTENCRVRRIDPGTGIIETIAGAGACTYGGDGGTAEAAGLHPWALAVDSGGAVFVADRENCRIRAFVPGGSIDTIAGNGTCGFSGDDGPAIDALLNQPGDLVTAEDDTIYVADTGNCRIRRIDGSGTISGVAGSGVCAPGGDGGPAVSGGAWHPIGLVMGPGGEWYFSELDTCRVRRVDSTGVVTTYAGNGLCGYRGDGGPADDTQLGGSLGGLALANDGTLFIAEGNNCRVRKVDPDGMIRTVAGTGTCDFSGDGGPALEASLNLVADVALDRSGGVLIAEPFNCRVRRVDLKTGTIDTIAGDGSCRFNGEDVPAKDAGIEPWGVAAGPEGSVYIADSGNCRARRVGPEGRITTVAGGVVCDNSGDGGPATQAQLLRPYDVVVDRLGNLYIADLRAFTVRRVDTEGVISTVAGIGISRPIDIGGFDPLNGNLCSVHALPVPVPTYLGDGGAANEGGLYFPYGIALDTDGHLYIADTFDHRVRRVACGAGIPCAGPVTPNSLPGEDAPSAPTMLPDTGRAGEPYGGVSLAGLIALVGAGLAVRTGLRLLHQGRRSGTSH